MLRAMEKVRLASLVLSLVSLVACQKPTPAEPASAPALAGPELTAMPGDHATPTPGSNELPPGHPSINGPAVNAPSLDAPSVDGKTMPPGHPAVGGAAPGAAPAGPAPTGPATAGGLTWNETAPLVRRAPKSNMRAAEYGIAGDDHAELSVFYFGEGAAGGVDANIERWLGQFSQADGSDTAKKAKRSEIKVAGMAVSQVETTGTFAGGMGNPGAGPATDYMLLGAIANGPNGAVFFKLTGPRAAVEKARAAFGKMVASLHPEAPTAH